MTLLHLQDPTEVLHNAIYGKQTLCLFKAHWPTVSVAMIQHKPCWSYFHGSKRKTCTALSSEVVCGCQLISFDSTRESEGSRRPKKNLEDACDELPSTGLFDADASAQDRLCVDKLSNERSSNHTQRGRTQYYSERAEDDRRLLFARADASTHHFNSTQLKQNIQSENKISLWK